MRSAFVTGLVAATTLLFCVPSGRAEPAPINASTDLLGLRKQQRHSGVRNSVWSVGIAGMRHSLKAGDGNEVLGNAAAVQLGTGYISHSWYLSGSVDILLGPYEPARGRQLSVDYVGTGATLWAGFSAQTLDLRSPAGGYGFALGLSYADSVGRSVGRNRRHVSGIGSEIDAANADLIDNYVLRASYFSLLPAIFFSWLEPGRPRGNSPELLATRLEGRFLTLGMAMPLLASYQAQYERIGDPGVKLKDSGRLRGYSIFVAFTALLGT